ncbi:PIR Superfamily Protein [Plasmodium ovale curtisi]|uniref:PIR Superfamily Protein n=1 Tax=Plasmodium ovale curtisi TaxID=864141 RepID=A0A1A8WQZ4_PLAOA|nr:PIR Superfamily Protein [Plasmodium ovale curtisi]
MKMGTEDDPDLKDLHTNVIYYKLDTASNDYINDNNPLWSTVIKNHHMKGLRIFDSLAKGLYYVSTMNKRDYTFYDERWNFLYFWTGLKILENSESSENSENSEFANIMVLLKAARSVYDKEEGSYENYMSTINKDEFKNLKEVYDYLQNYKSIILKIGFSGSTPCTSRYKDYVTKAHELYISEKQKCQGNGNDEYCKILKSFLHKHAETFLIQPKCTGTKVVVPHSEEDPQDSVHKEGTVSQHQSHGQGAQVLYPPPGDAWQTRGMSFPDGDISPSSESTGALSTVLPLLGTASLTFFFLKFTPLGSRLHGSIFRKQIIQSNEEEEAKEILENSYEFAQTNIEDTAHHIAYHSM